MTNKTDADFADAICRICENDELRREMLWLRAMERHDEKCARRLELVDDQLRDRLAPVIRSAAELSPEQARELYGAAQEVLLARA